MAQPFVGTDMELRAHLIDRHRIKSLLYAANWNASEDEPVFSTRPRAELDAIHNKAHTDNRFRGGKHAHKGG